VTRAINCRTYASGPANLLLAHACNEYENKLDQHIGLIRSFRSAYPMDFFFVRYVVPVVKKLPPEKKDERLEEIHTIIKTPQQEEDIVLCVT
jgi:hypothetical protein